MVGSAERDDHVHGSRDDHLLPGPKIGRDTFGSQAGGLHGSVSEGNGDVDVAHSVHVEGLHFDYERIHLTEHRPSLPQGA